MIQVLEMEIFFLSFEMHSVFFDPGEEREKKEGGGIQQGKMMRIREEERAPNVSLLIFLVHHIQVCSFFLSSSQQTKWSAPRGDEMRENTKSESRRGSLSYEEIISLLSSWRFKWRAFFLSSCSLFKGLPSLFLSLFLPCCDEEEGEGRGWEERRPVISEGCEEDHPLWFQSCFEGAFYLLKMIPLSFFFSSFPSSFFSPSFHFSCSFCIINESCKVKNPPLDWSRPASFLFLLFSQTDKQTEKKCSVVRCEQRLSCLWSVLGKVSSPLKRQAWRIEAFPRTSSLPTGGTLTSLTKIGCQDRSLWHWFFRWR